MLVTKKFDKEENRILSLFRKQVTLFIASFVALVKLASMWHNKRAYNTFLTLRISTLLQMYFTNDYKMPVDYLPMFQFLLPVAKDLHGVQQPRK